MISARRRLAHNDGVHPSTTQPGLEREPEELHGRSCHNGEEVRRAVAEGAAYATVSPVAPTESKPGYGPALGVPGLRQLVKEAQGTPVFALGGVTTQNADAIRAGGAHGVALMGALMRSTDPAATFRLLREAMKKGIPEIPADPEQLGG